MGKSKQLSKEVKTVLYWVLINHAFFAPLSREYRKSGGNMAQMFWRRRSADEFISAANCCIVLEDGSGDILLEDGSGCISPEDC